MKSEFTNILQIALFLVVLTCLVSIMALFMGGGQASNDLHSLLMIQTIAVPLATVVLIAVIARSNLKTLWRALPQWLVFIVLLLNALALCGEIALVAATRMTERVGLWQEHVPLVCMMMCSAAFLVLYATAHPSTVDKPALSGRW